jgi:hypothetical protein
MYVPWKVISETESAVVLQAGGEDEGGKWTATAEISSGSAYVSAVYHQSGEKVEMGEIGLTEGDLEEMLQHLRKFKKTRTRIVYFDDAGDAWTRCGRADEGATVWWPGTGYGRPMTEEELEQVGLTPTGDSLRAHREAESQGRLITYVDGHPLWVDGDIVIIEE